jgi:AcrR family transcriptional regulator
MRMKSEDRREEILRAAVRLFAEKGFRGTTTRELASTVGVSEPVLYQHFSNKNELYRAIIEVKAREALQGSEKLRELAQSDDDRAFLRALAATILDRYSIDEEWTRLLLFSCLERHELSQLFYDRLVHDVFRLVCAYIRRRIRVRAFRKVNPEIAARGLVGMIAYQGLMSMLFPEKITLQNRRRVVEETVTLFLDGITTQATARTQCPRTAGSGTSYRC